MCKNKAELDVLVAKKRKMSSLKKKLEAKLEAIDAEITAYAEAKGERGGKDQQTYIVYGDDYKVSCILITKYPFDNDKLKAFLGDKVADFQKVSSYRRVDIR
jgi:hypothetical protein